MRIAPDLDPTVLLPPFEDWLPVVLRLAGERALLERHFLTRASYSTERFLSDNSLLPDSVLRTIPVGNSSLLHFEAGSSELFHYCAKHGLQLASEGGVMVAAELVQVALSKIIERNRFLTSAVSELVWRCHVVHAQDDNYDVSFSDPSIPFSIFISAPVRNDQRSILRVAESLVHETMHLQLTLFEAFCPLVDTASAWTMYSPWKRQERPAQGILHGLYVFHVLRWMWHQFSLTTHNEIDRNFSFRRIQEIDDEILSVRDFEKSPVLTESGNKLLQKLFAADLIDK